jgi:hypothetical protein
MNSDALKDSAHMIKDKEFLKTRAAMILSGIQLAVELKRSIKNLILMH